MDVSTVKGVVDRLRGRGLVSAETLHSDSRLLILTPTPRGKAKYHELLSKAKDVSQQTLSPLSIDERRYLMKLLKKLV